MKYLEANKDWLDTPNFAFEVDEADIDTGKTKSGDKDDDDLQAALKLSAEEDSIKQALKSSLIATSSSAVATTAASKDAKEKEAKAKAEKEAKEKAEKDMETEIKDFEADRLQASWQRFNDEDSAAAQALQAANPYGNYNSYYDPVCALCCSLVCSFVGRLLSLSDLFLPSIACWYSTTTLPRLRCSCVV